MPHCSQSQKVLWEHLILTEATDTAIAAAFLCPLFTASIAFWRKSYSDRLIT
jgi:hypothetical protein